MMSNTQELAFFKKRPTTSLPIRKGAIQCVRICTECVTQKTKIDLDESILRIKSFDDLVTRKSIWFESYQTIQYHVGQFDILSQHLKCHAGKLVIYVVAATRPSDIRFLNMVLEQVRLPEHNKEVVQVSLTSCLNSTGYPDGESTGCFQLQASRILGLAGENPLIVPISITKDHNNTSKLFAIGSVCVQLLEPYPLQDYTKSSSTFIQHLYSDLILNSVILPTHLVAFIILYANPVTIEEMTTFIDWFRRSSIDSDMQLGFTGDSRAAVEFGLIVVRDYIQPATKQSFKPKHLEALFTYANMVAPFVIHYGIIARAIITVYNQTTSSPLSSFDPNVRVRVMVDKVRDESYALAETVNSSLSAHKPCISNRTYVENTIDRMQRLGHYFKIEEPKIVSRKARPWADDNSDDEYFQQNSNNPALKSWLVLTEDKKKLCRLNMLVNATEDYL